MRLNSYFQTFNTIAKTKQTNTNIKFSQIGGNEDAKKEFRLIVDFLKNPYKYTSKGLKLPKGVLLYGPPGTGKTLIAKVPFLSGIGE
jgi:cell division protease FtsH